MSIDFLCVLVYLYLFYILLIFVVNLFLYIVRDIEVLRPCLQTGKKVLRRCAHKKALAFFFALVRYIFLYGISFFSRFSYTSTYFLYFLYIYFYFIYFYLLMDLYI